MRAQCLSQSKEFLGGIRVSGFLDLLDALGIIPFWVSDNFQRCEVSIHDVANAIRILENEQEDFVLPNTLKDFTKDEILEALYDIGNYADQDDIITLLF